MICRRLSIQINSLTLPSLGLSSHVERCKRREAAAAITRPPPRQPPRLGLAGVRTLITHNHCAKTLYRFLGMSVQETVAEVTICTCVHFFPIKNVVLKTSLFSSLAKIHSFG